MVGSKAREFEQQENAMKYRMAQNFDGGNFDVFDAFQLDGQNLTHQIV